MNHEGSNKADLRQWGRSLIQLSSAGLVLSLAFSILWVAILIWSDDGSQWKVASILGATSSLAIGAILVAVRRRLYSFMALLASEFSAPVH